MTKEEEIANRMHFYRTRLEAAHSRLEPLPQWANGQPLDWAAIASKTDIRDNRDPQTVGMAYLARNNGGSHKSSSD